MSLHIPGTRTIAARLTIAVVALVLVSAACSDGGDDQLGSGATTSAVGATTVAPGGDDATSAEPTSPTAGDGSTTTASTGSGDSTTSTTTSTTGSSTTIGDDDLAGEPWDGFAQDGDVLAVFGVAHDDLLNVRAGPGTDREILTEVAPTADGLVATGRARALPRSFWYEVSVDGVTGWVSQSFVAFEGGTDDATAEYLAGAGRTGAETMVELGEIVAAALGSDDPPSDVVQVVAPTVGDLGEVTFDVVGLADDAGAGYRVHVFATPNDDGETFDLRTIERTSFCTRGVAGELCR